MIASTFASLPIDMQVLIECGIVSSENDECFNRVLSPEAVAALAEPEIQRRIAEKQAAQSRVSAPEVDKQVVAVKNILSHLDGFSPCEINHILARVRLAIQWYGVVTTTGVVQCVGDEAINALQSPAPVL